MKRRPPSMPVSKRVLDITVCGSALVLLAPLLLAIAILIKLSSRGPVLYIAPRAGRFGIPFGQLKFRTMHTGADKAGAFTAHNDSRVFAVGRFLRLFKLDELPQLWNVVRGDMSVVGPRPEDLATVRECYNAGQMQVLAVAPGLTGLPQVRFFPELSVIDPRGLDPQQHYRRLVLPMRLEMDLEYVRRQSLPFDLYLIAWTAWLILFKSWFILLAGQKQRGIEEFAVEAGK
ncbi:MAG: sugar transferase [Acidobacteria bacterium]|nr:sugar transferase [Acidobacteriota bacterium]